MKWRMMLALLGVVAVMLVAQGVPLAAHLRRVERDRALASLERDAFILAGQAATPLADGAGTGSPDPASPAVVTLSETVAGYARSSERGITVADPDGTVVAAAGDDQPDVGALITGDTEFESAVRLLPASSTRDGDVVVAVPVLDGATVVGVVRVTASTDDIDARVGEQIRGLVTVAIISLAAAALVAGLLTATVVGPLRRLQRSARRVAAGEYDERADERDGPPEIRQVAASFNEMTGKVTSLVEQQRSFAGDASHQLRTPLTALRLRLERTGALVGTDPAGALRNLAAAEDEIARLQRLVDGLLALARSSAGTTAIPVDADAIAAERVAEWSPLAEEQGITVRHVSGGGALALAAPGALEQMVDNLLDNALSHAPTGTDVDVAVVPTPSGIEVHVRDAGPGLTDEQMAQAFHRFWRAPDAPAEGSGLGLAIVSQLATASGGSAHLARHTTGGLDAYVRLRPALPTAASSVPPRD